MQIVFLTKQFYADYNYKNYEEILYKEKRPYIMLLAKIEGITFAIPLRSNITHSYAFKTILSEEGTQKGLDFLKAVVISDRNKYVQKIDRMIAIPPDEFNIILCNKHKIIKQFSKFIKTYKKKCSKNIYVYSFEHSSLKYFHRELGII